MAQAPKRPAPTRAIARPTSAQALVPQTPLRSMRAWNDFAAKAKASGDVNLISPVVAIDHLPAMTQLALQAVTM